MKTRWYQILSLIIQSECFNFSGWCTVSWSWELSYLAEKSTDILPAESWPNRIGSFLISSLISFQTLLRGILPLAHKYKQVSPAPIFIIYNPTTRLTAEIHLRYAKNYSPPPSPPRALLRHEGRVFSVIWIKGIQGTTMTIWFLLLKMMC